MDARVRITLTSRAGGIAPGDLSRFFDRLSPARRPAACVLHVLRGLAEANRGRVVAELLPGERLAVPPGPAVDGR